MADRSLPTGCPPPSTSQHSPRTRGAGTALLHLAALVCVLTFQGCSVLGGLACLQNHRNSITLASKPSLPPPLMVTALTECSLHPRHCWALSNMSPLFLKTTLRGRCHHCPTAQIRESRLRQGKELPSSHSYVVKLGRSDSKNLYF